MEPSAQQCAGAVLMMAPHDFEFNEETSFDNVFQSRPSDSPAQINARAMAEFTALVQGLTAHGVDVLLPQRRTQGPRTPDAVFPNNWFATEHDGTVLLFPMAPPGRRLEKRLEAVEAALDGGGYQVRNIINIGRFYETAAFLEGTGSMVIDHPRRRVYAARSERCTPAQLHNFAALRGYRCLEFDTRTAAGQTIYHTNVMMSVGERFAVVCSAAIVDPDDRRRVLAALEADHEVIDISQAQVADAMCGNILQLRAATPSGRLVVMSTRAWTGFGEAQQEALRRHGEILATPLDTLEAVGGGSARCMLAEVFLPRRAAAPV